MSSSTTDITGGAIGEGRLDVVCEDHNACYSITGWYDVWLIMEG